MFLGSKATCRYGDALNLVANFCSLRLRFSRVHDHGRADIFKCFYCRCTFSFLSRRRFGSSVCTSYSHFSDIQTSNYDTPSDSHRLEVMDADEAPSSVQQHGSETSCLSYFAFDG
jgi:hypothetical protein